MEKNKLLELELMRGFAMLGIVAIHVFNVGLTNLPPGGKSNLLFNCFNGFLQFAVPVFIFISAVVAAYTNRDKPLRLTDYYCKKIVRVGVPYLFWTIFYLIFRVLWDELTWGHLARPHSWLYWLLWGKGYDHLYFLSLIIQFYIIFPLFFKLVKAVKNRPFIAFLLALLPQIGIYWLNKLYIYQVTPHFSTSFVRFYFIAFVGMWLGLNYEKVVARLERRWLWAALVFALTSAIQVYYTILSVQQQSFHTFPQNLNYQFYMLSAGLLLLGLSRRLLKPSGKLNGWLAWVGQYSFGIYLIHPILTFALVHLTVGLGGWTMLLLCLTLVPTVTVVSGLIVKHLQKWPPVAYVLGEGKLKKIN